MEEINDLFDNDYNKYLDRLIDKDYNKYLDGLHKKYIKHESECNK